MSGIVGIYHLNQEPTAEPGASDDLHKMTDALAHRGPDGVEVWCDGPIGLGHRMLWTTPESLLETLPLTKGGLSLTADARIDNRDELIQLLAMNHCAAEKITDSDIILAAYEKWGESCSDRLLGDFAFAIWDAEEQKLFCARDHFGVKPFYYYYQPGECFVFASEIKALLSLPQVPRRLNEVRLGDYLTLTMADKTITSFQKILRLAPAHSMVITPDGVDARCYWALDPRREILLSSDQVYAQEFRKIFTEAVRCRLRSAFPIASQLSGGLDSSSVTCVARDLLMETNGSQLHTISTIFDQVSECDERPFINAVLEKGNLISHYIYGDQSSPLADVETILRYEDEVYVGPNHFYPWIANRAANELGFRIVLDGFDGDTTVSHGVLRLRELAYQGDWEMLFYEAQAISEKHPISQYQVIQRYGLPYLHRLLQRWQWMKFAKIVQLIHHKFDVSRKYLIWHQGLKPLWQRLWKSKRSAGGNEALCVNALVNHDFAKSIGLNERIQALEPPCEPSTTLRREHWLELTQGVLPLVLEQVDRYAACFSLEVRHPFMDKRLIEFCLALPAEQKLSQGFGRMIMRRALEGVLPEAVQWRPIKADLSANFDYGFLNRDRPILEEVMGKK